MIREKSCGAVVYSVTESRVRYLIVQMQQGHFGFPKGHAERNETEAQTALREIREETGLTVSLIPGFRQTVTYAPYDGCIKEVVYFAAVSRQTETVRQEAEIRAIQWLPLKAALAVLSHENDRQILTAAHAFLTGSEG